MELYDKNDYDISYRLINGKNNGRKREVHDITNMKLKNSRLHPYKFIGKNKEKGGYFWICKCDCGNETLVNSKDFLSLHKRSCGCVQKMNARKQWIIQARKQDKSHGATGNDWYNNNYCNMLNRIFRKDYAYREHYLNNIKGKKIEQSWVDNPWNFYKEIGPKPFKSATIDRIDNSKGYVNGNVRWATKQQQARNRNANGQGKIKYVGIRPSGCKSYKYRVYILGKLIYKTSDIKEAMRARYNAETKLGFSHCFDYPD